MALLGGGVGGVLGAMLLGYSTMLLAAGVSAWMAAACVPRARVT